MNMEGTALTSRSAQFRERGIGAALVAPLVRIVWAALVTGGLMVAAWCIDAVFVFHVWPEGIDALRGILAEDLGRATQLGGEGSLLARLAAGMGNAFYAVVFEWSGVHEMGRRFSEAAALSIPDTITRSAYFAHQAESEVAMVATQLFGVRVALLVTAAPLLGLLYAVAFADGLVQRAIRRSCSGRESSSLYHRAKFLQLVMLAGMLALTLLLPISLDPRAIWVPGAVLMATAASVQWRYYKKHLWPIGERRSCDRHPAGGCLIRSLRVRRPYEWEPRAASLPA